MRTSLLALALLAAASPVLSQDDDPHLAEVDGLRILHVWTPATSAGSDALFYMDIENTSATEARLTGGAAMGAALDLVGFSYGAAGEAWTVLPGLPVPAGGEIVLEPKLLALRWTGIPEALVEGAELEIEVALGGRLLHADVEIGASDADAHGHAGHDH